MGSDKTRALLGFAKLLVAAVAGYGMYYVWMTERGNLENDFIPYAPYVAGIVAALMVFLLLSKLNKGAD